jgi:hypothetical protein
MAIPTTREGLKQYCLRDLGAPVLEINVDDDQLEDRIDEALDYWRQYHYDGIEEVYLKQVIRASEVTLTTSVAGTFSNGEKITGATSGATAIVTTESQRTSNGTLLLVKKVTGTFTAGEAITGSMGHNATLSSITLREYDNKYITIPDYVWGITGILNIGQASSSKNMFDLQYQLRLNDLYDLLHQSFTTQLLCNI